MKYNVAFFRSNDYENIASIKGISNYESAMSIIRELKKSVDMQSDCEYTIQLVIKPDEEPEQEGE